MTVAVRFPLMSAAPRSSRPHSAGRPDEYFSRGFEAYVAGRHATFCRYVEVAATLFHFAVELMLKAELLKPANETMRQCLDEAMRELIAELGPGHDPDKRRLPEPAADRCLEPYNARSAELKDLYVHSLPRLWADYKAQVREQGLDRFDPLITQLEQLDDLRYPTHIRSRGNVISFSPRKGEASRTRVTGELVNRYALSRDAVDELVAAIVAASAWSPEWVRTHARSRGAEGLETYTRENRHVNSGDARPTAPAPQPQAEPPVAEPSFMGGQIVGGVVGLVLGVGLALIVFVLWYNVHCGQVPVFGGSYCR